MKKIKLFATPKRTLLTCVSLAAILAVAGTGSALAASVVAENTSIGKTAAEKAAFADANLTASDVSVTRTEFEFEKGKFVYEVDFVASGTEYEYTLDAATGAIVKKETDSGTTQQGSATVEITLQQAKEIALTDAGVTAAEVTFTKEKVDRDDGRYEYDLEFVSATHKYEYEINASSGAIVDMSVHAIQQNAVATPAPNAGLITLAEAKEKALTDAGVAAADASFTKEKLDRDDGVYHYEVEFVSAGKKYDYDINATTGDVMEKGVKNVQSTQAPVSDTGLITLAEAKEKALADAGITATDASFTKEKMDKDDGRYIYEIDFATANTRYDYEIDAATGDVVDKDVETIHLPVSDPTDTTTYIGADKAKEAALAHAGLTAAEVTFTKAKAEKDDGRHIYEIEFFKGYVEYEYEIDAVTGKVIDFEKDIDD